VTPPNHDPSGPDATDLRPWQAQVIARISQLEERIGRSARATDDLNARVQSSEDNFRDLLSILESYMNQAAAYQTTMDRRMAESRPDRKPMMLAAAALLVCVMTAAALLAISMRRAPADSARQTPAPSAVPAPAVAASPQPADVVSPPPADVAASTPADTAAEQPPEAAASRPTDTATARAVAVASPSKVASPPKAEPRPTAALADPSAPGRLNVVLEATEATWVLLTTDSGVTLVNRLLQPGASATVRLEGAARLRAGNAGGLVAQVGGKAVGPIGPHGRVRDVAISPDGSFRVVVPAQ